MKVLAAVLAAMALAPTAGAARAYEPAQPVELRVVDRETGQVLRVWRHDGRAFVAGRPGARYALRVTNHTGGRVLVVLSVDGVNILSGESADYGQRGYVFAPHETYDLTGWRKSLSEVAAFTFTSLPDSYAARTGRPADVGVIGMAVFKERVRAYQPVPDTSDGRTYRPRRGAGAPADTEGLNRAPVPPPAPSTVPPPPAPPPPYEAPQNGARAEGAGAGAYGDDGLDRDRSSGMAQGELSRRDEKLGTGHGAREWSVTTEVPFERASSRPNWVSQVEYDSWNNLVLAGVIPGRPDWPRHPRPFPTEPDGGPWVPDPPGL